MHAPLIQAGCRSNAKRGRAFPPVVEKSNYVEVLRILKSSGDGGFDRAFGP